MGSRRQAREAALMILFELDGTDMPLDVALERFFAHFSDAAPHGEPFRIKKGDMPRLSASARSYAEELVRGVVTHQAELDGAISRVSTTWRLERMAKVDRNVLRLGAYEVLKKQGEVPRSVAISEAIDVAKRFGTDESGAFVNGILDRIDAPNDDTRDAN